LSKHRARLQQGGAECWCLFDRCAGDFVQQVQLATTLRAIGARGRDAFYSGDNASAIGKAVRRLGGTLSESDLEMHSSVVAPPIETAWGELRIATQPPMSQGVPLNMATAAMSRLADFPVELDDHIAIELTEAAFAYRAEVSKGSALLEHSLVADPQKASQRGAIWQVPIDDFGDPRL
jgi:gamma-glutamyltranspeptidase / glutathione hydrolase